MSVTTYVSDDRGVVRFFAFVSLTTYASDDLYHNNCGPIFTPMRVEGGEGGLSGMVVVFVGGAFPVIITNVEEIVNW